MKHLKLFEAKKEYVTFYHGTTMHKGLKIMQTGLTARFYEPQWFTIADEKDGIGLSYYHAKSRNNGRSPCVIEIKLPKDIVREYVYREGGLKKPIDAKYCRIMSEKEIQQKI